MVIFGLLLPVALAAGTVTPIADGQVNCSQYGPGYASIETLKHVELYASQQTACVRSCACRKPQLNCMDIEPNEYAKRIAKATCDLVFTVSKLTYGCTFRDQDGGTVAVKESVAAYNERALDNPRCVLKGSLYVDYSTDFSQETSIYLISLGIVLGILAVIGIVAFAIYYRYLRN